MKPLVVVAVLAIVFGTAGDTRADKRRTIQPVTITDATLPPGSVTITNTTLPPIAPGSTSLLWSATPPAGCTPTVGCPTLDVSRCATIRLIARSTQTGGKITVYTWIGNKWLILGLALEVPASPAATTVTYDTPGTLILLQWEGNIDEAALFCR